MTDTDKRKAGAIWHGMVPDDHPIYRSGWNFLLAPNLKPDAKRAPEGDDGDGDGEAT